MGDFTIEKNRIDAVIHFSDGSKSRGELFLLPFNSYYDAHQKISDLLESEQPFLPLSLDDGNKVEFINKSQLLLIECELPEDGEEDPPELALFHQTEVSIVTVDNQIFKGVMFSEVPLECSRLSDCLNLSVRFVRMKSNNRYMHVNKNLIKKVVGAC